MNRRERLEYLADYRRTRRRLGLCAACGREQLDTATLCRLCADKLRDRARKRRKEK